MKRHRLLHLLLLSIGLSLGGCAAMHEPGYTAPPPNAQLPAHLQVPDDAPDD